MSIRRSARPVTARRLEALARSLLGASSLCAIASISPGGRAHVNTAYFAWSERFDVVWLSDPRSTHSRNLLARPAAAVAVYDSHQSWGEPDRGIQLFGTARQADGLVGREAGRVYQDRFPAYDRSEFGGYRLYRFRPGRMKVFDERALGPGTFLIASVHGGRLSWIRTEIVEPDPER